MRAVGNQCNFTFERWLGILTHLGEQAGCAKVMEAAGVAMGNPKHKRKAAAGLINLGTMEYNRENDITFASYMPPVDYDDFVQDLIAAREAGK